MGPNQDQTTDKGIRTGNPPIQNAHIFPFVFACFILDLGWMDMSPGTSSSTRVKFSLSNSWHEPLILVGSIPPSRSTGMGTLSNGWLTWSIMIRAFSRCVSCTFLHELYCFLIDFLLSLTFFWNFFPKRSFCSPSKQWAPFFRSDFTWRLSLSQAVNTLCLNIFIHKQNWNIFF